MLPKPQLPDGKQWSSQTQTGSLTVTSASDKASLENIPPEIAGIIAEFLDDSAINNLRASSKQLAITLALEFHRRHFAERNHTLTAFGIEELVQITRQPGLCGLLKVVVFNLSTDPSRPASIDQDSFIQSIKLIFSNIARHQGSHGITIGFSDNIPTQEKEHCSDTMYRIAEKPSYGWYTLLPKHRNTRAFRIRPGVRSLGLVPLGAAMQRILPLALESGCKISGLELRIVGRLHLTDRRIQYHEPSVATILDNTQIPAEWDMKLFVVEINREYVSSIQFAGNAQTLKFHQFPLGDLDIDTISGYTYDLASKIFAGKFKNLELVDCFIRDMNEFDEQMESLATIDTHDIQLEGLLIRGLWVCDNLNWGKFFQTTSEVKTLKRCVIQALQLEPVEPMDDDDVNEDDQSGEAGSEQGGGIGSEQSEEAGGEENENDSMEVDEDEGPKAKLARLGRVLAGVNIDLIRDCDGNFVKVLLKTSAEVQDID